MTKAEARDLEKRMVETERAPKSVGRCDWCGKQAETVRENTVLGALTCDHCTWECLNDCAYQLEEAGF